MLDKNLQYNLGAFRLKNCFYSDNKDEMSTNHVTKLK